MPAILAAVVGLLTIGVEPAMGGEWTRSYVRGLPDEAFASVEVRPDGTRARHLPHHDGDGRVDLAHLRSALARLRQVKWADPPNADRARNHLLEHIKDRGLSTRPE